jgi:uncharacterized protein YegJ (DUF2314 family)
MRGYTLTDAAARQREHPKTFQVPAAATLAGLRPGSCVKLEFVVDPPRRGIVRERLWVELTQRGAGELRGRLVNSPVVVSAVRYGSEVRFEPRHILAVREPAASRAESALELRRSPC